MKNCKSNVLQKKNMLILIFVGYCFAVLVKTVIFLAPFKCSDFILASSVETSKTSLSCRHKKDDTNGDNLLPQNKLKKKKKTKVQIMRKRLRKFYGNCCKVVLCIFLALCLANLLFFIPFNNSKDNFKTYVSSVQESNLQSKPFLITCSRSDCEKRIKYVSKKRKKEKSISKSGSNCFYNSQKKISRINAKDSVLLSEMYETGPNFKETIIFNSSVSGYLKDMSLNNFLGDWIYKYRWYLINFMDFLNYEIVRRRNGEESLFDYVTKDDLYAFFEIISPNSCFVPSDFSIDTFINVFISNIPFAKIRCRLPETENIECTINEVKSDVEAWKSHLDKIFQNDEKNIEYKLSISQWNFSVFLLRNLLIERNINLDDSKKSNLRYLEVIFQMLYKKEEEFEEYVKNRFGVPLEYYRSLDKDSSVNFEILLDTVIYDDYQNLICK